MVNNKITLYLVNLNQNLQHLQVTITAVLCPLWILSLKIKKKFSNFNLLSVYQLSNCFSKRKLIRFILINLI